MRRTTIYNVIDSVHDLPASYGALAQRHMNRGGWSLRLGPIPDLSRKTMQVQRIQFVSTILLSFIAATMAAPCESTAPLALSM